MTELVGTQKLSPSKIDPASILRSQLINSEEDGADSRRILSEMGTIPCDVNLMQNQPASDYIHTDDEQSN